MCGIFGGFDRSGQGFDPTAAAESGRRLAHRGPDGQGVWSHGGFLLGNQRLAVLDVEHGRQPMFSDDGRIVVVQNGEIYNFVELAQGLDCRTQCDTEVLLRLYEREGPDFVRRLNGMFAAAIVDLRNNELWLFRDRLGKKPLYLHDDGRRLVFASEIKSLFPLGAPRRLNEEAVDLYLTYNFVPPPETMFAGIVHLPPASRMRVDLSGASLSTWWSLPPAPDDPSAQEADPDELLELLRDAVRIRMRSDVPVGAFLSGGVDSSLTVKLMSEVSSTPVQVFCIGFEDPRFDESQAAAEAARHCGAELTVDVMPPDWVRTWPAVMYHNDQPHGDASFIPMRWLSRMARRDVTVVLTGDGGDELFAGYDVHRRFFETWTGGAGPDFQRAYLQAIHVFGPETKAELYAETLRKWAGRDDPIRRVEGMFAGLEGHDPVNQALGLDVKLLLPGNNLVKPDRMAMAESLEPRAPMLDYRVVEWAFRQPGRTKLRDGRTKHVLKQAAERLLPAAWVNRRKQMFTVPIGEWFKGPLQGFARGVLFDRRTLDRGLFEPSAVERLLARHIAGTEDHTRCIRAMIALEMWQRTWMDDEFDHPPTFTELGLPEPMLASVQDRS